MGAGQSDAMTDGDRAVRDVEPPSRERARRRRRAARTSTRRRRSAGGILMLAGVALVAAGLWAFLRPGDTAPTRVESVTTVRTPDPTTSPPTTTVPEDPAVAPSTTTPSATTGEPRETKRPTERPTTTITTTGAVLIEPSTVAR
ncbi:MAG: hypothetical protein R2698_04380 [Microthrixaceae bacterium]